MKPYLKFTRSFVWALVGCSLLVFAAWESSADERPNIILILADDLGWGDIGCYGQTTIQTPNLDRMAAEGMRFTQVYAGSTVCAPSRCALMTGRHTGHCRVRGNARVPLEEEDVTVAEVLRGVGYRTALIGKWGLGEPETTGIPTRQGFDYFFGYLNQHHAHNYYPTHLWRNEQKVPLKNEVPNEDSVGGGMAEKRVEYSHDLFAEEALEWVEQARSDPFFLYLALTIPHANNEAGQKGMEVPSLGIYADRDWPEPQKGHAAMITRMDRDIGRLIERIRELGLERRTLVLFSSDNGPHREGGNDPQFNDSNGPLRGIKRDLTDGGIRVPTLAWWPGTVPAGTVSDHVWYFPDILPTFAELAGIPAPNHPQPLDGVSIASVLRDPPPGPQRPWRHLYWEFHERGFKQAVRWGPWKAIRSGVDRPLELYHLTADSGEEYDLAVHYPQVVRELEDYLKAARTESPHWPVDRPGRSASRR